MSLEARLLGIEETMDGNCSLGRFIHDLNDTEAEILNRLLATSREKLSNSRLHRELAAEGHRFARDTIAQHRNQNCACYYGKETP